MITLAIRIDATGTGHCLYSEAIDLTAIGRLEMRRASTIEFNTKTQKWEVRSPAGKRLFSNTSRAVCLAWEQQQFNR